MDTKVVDLLIGALIDGRYRIRGRVARGGMATVYTATDERLERTVALKIIHPTQSRDPHFLERFTDEAKTIARLTHPNVVAVYDQGVHEGLPYLIMEYVRGRTLREMLSDRRRLNPPEALAILEQVLAAVAAAHRAGLVHRDIKPENVLVAEAPGGGSLLDAVVKVADFGLARAVEASADDKGGQLLATVAYVAPELVTDGRADPRTDIYSAGIVLFEMLTGRVPYEGDKPVEIAWRHVDQDVPPPSKYVAGLSPALDALVARATRRDPGGRPSDAGVMLAEVQAAREEGTSAPAGAHAAAAPTMAVPLSPAASTQIISMPGAMPNQRPSWARLPDAPPPPRANTGTVHRAGDLLDRDKPGMRQRFASMVDTTGKRRAVAIALVLVGVLVAGSGYWFGVGRYTSAPSLTQITQAQALAKAKQHGLKVKIGPGRYDEKIAKGTVVGQQPGGNQRILRGGTVTLTLSLGPERYTVPNEQGRAYSEAAGALTAMKMVPKRVDKYDDSLPAGFVLSTDPGPGTIVPPGAQITVNVSKGKAPIQVPNVIGQDQATATQQLTGLGLKVATTQQQSDKPAGQVINQSIPDGAGVEKDATIILTVSSGPPQVAVPNVSNVGLSFDQANQVLQQAGLVGVQVLAIPGGQVRQQNPPAGTPVAPGTQVQLWITP
ncbi:Stk1 family PASTA domain-containing Ser/Thr kinase [Rugosimonospora africana]|uniref:non-specific serine/threonine protein kinase n=1 Tax=Rugosimonospora africana TaxID=556532 RepID=A0A8J3QXG9_9ACTN|nr:Stk1 family PASTA domain-containing Ser/Thr kinase [Rugosimonospora africana]GIH18678.1 serine/threonine protein kinase [Rugosimonospora africana]